MGILFIKKYSQATLIGTVDDPTGALFIETVVNRIGAKLIAVIPSISAANRVKARTSHVSGATSGFGP